MDDPELAWFCQELVLSEKFGWTLEYIRNMEVDDLFMTLGFIKGQNKITESQNK